MRTTSRHTTGKRTKQTVARARAARATRRSGRVSRGFLTLLGGAYVLAIIWTSLVYAAEGHAPFTVTPAGAAADAPPSFVAVEPPPPGLLPAAPGVADPRDVRGYVQTAARQGGVDPRVAEWIVSHESGHHALATGDGGDSRGLWQINRVWHPEVSDRCAYDVRCSTRWSIQRLRDGYANEWSTWRFRHSWFAGAPQSLVP